MKYEKTKKLPEKNPGKMADEKGEDDSHEDESEVVFLLSTILFPSDRKHINWFEALVTTAASNLIGLLNRSLSYIISCSNLIF